MLRWVSLCCAIACFGIAYSTKSVGLLGTMILLGSISFIVFGLSFIAARVQSATQGQTGRADYLLMAQKGKLNKVNELKAKLEAQSETKKAKQ